MFFFILIYISLLFNIPNVVPQSGGNADYDDYYDPDADRSYSFSYAEDRGIPGWISRRQEQADSNGQVKGRYSYVNDDGNEIAVQYSAGAGIGFKVENKNELKSQVRKATFGGISKGKRMKVVKRPRNKSRNGGSAKRVKVVAKSSRRNGSNNRRKVVRKGQRRVSPVVKKGLSATPLSIVGKSSSMGRKPLGKYKVMQNYPLR